MPAARPRDPPRTGVAPAAGGDAAPAVWLHRAAVAGGVLAAAGLLWFVGPLVAVAGVVPLAGEPARAVAVAAVVLAVLAHAAWRHWRSARENRRLLEGLLAAREAPGPAPGGPPGAAAGAKEVALLGRRFEKAVETLRRSRIGAGRRPWWLAALAGRPYVYQLPWYVIIGAPGAGKTTALVNSGLEFPLADAVGRNAIRGIGGTRHCDWWFASEAVLIDTAGRYTTHDSDRDADRAAWLGFLDLLARHRPRRPINGVLLTISVSELLASSPEQRAAHAAKLRERIEELHARLGIAFPVYVLVTKTDLLAGFMEFFADFDKDERAQVWGVTFPFEPAAADGPLVRMASDFAMLEKRLHDCMMERLHGERDRERRSAIYGFLQQWHVLRQTLFDLLQSLLGELRPELRPWMRGVYFTSATQEGTPMDRALGELGRALGLASRIVAPARPSGKAFFVTQLVHDVVLGEAGLAGTNLRWRRRRTRLQWGLAGAAAVATLAASVLAWRAYADNRDALAAAAARLPALAGHVATGVAAGAGDPVALLPTLDLLANAGTPDAAAPRVVRAGFDLGLDRRGMLQAATHDAYERTLREAFLPRIAARLETRLRSAATDHVERVYETLKAYLMLFGGRHFDAAALRAYLVTDWDTTLPPTVRPDQREALRRHLDRLLATGEVGAPSHADQALIAGARSVVASVPLAELAYQRLKQLDAGPEVPPFTLESAGGPAARRAFVFASGRPLTHGVSALYSRAVAGQSLRERTQEVLRQFAGEAPWVIGAAVPAVADAASQEALAQQIQRLYRVDHAARWSEFLGDLRLAPTPTLAASAEQAALLARPDSPLLALMRAVVREVSPPGDAPGGRAADPQQAAFDALARFFVGQPAPAEAMQSLLGRLATHLTAVEDAARRKALPPASDVTRELQAMAQQAPAPLGAMLGQLAAASGAQVFATLREPIAAQLAGDFAPACTRAVTGRYPMLRNATEEISRDDFARAFGPGGLVDGFFQQKLAPYVDTSARPWAWRRADAGGRGEGSEALAQFQRAQAIRDAFFGEGARRLGTRLEFRLVSLDPGVSELVLDIDGQPLRFRPGARDAQSVQWPGPAEGGRVQVQLAPSAGHGYVFKGPWALFRLLDRVRVEPGGAPNRVNLLLDVEGRKARLEVRSASAVNPMLREELEQFQCPRRL